MTGGRIEVEQAGERKAKGGWLRGRFRSAVTEVLTDRLGGRPVGSEDSGWVEVVYRDDGEPDPAMIRRVGELYDAGGLVEQIAAEIGLSRAAVTAVLDARFAAEGRERPDGRARRAGLVEKHTEPPAYRQLSERVKELADAGLLFGAIAAELKMDRYTVTAAWQYWHEQRGLPAPDGRTRRKALGAKSGEGSG